jgi:hypothetical protein
MEKGFNAQGEALLAVQQVRCARFDAGAPACISKISQHTMLPACLEGPTPPACYAAVHAMHLQQCCRCMCECLIAFTCSL